MLGRIAQIQPVPKLLYTRKQATEAFSLSIRTIDTIVSTKELKARRRSAKVLIPWSELVKYATVQETKDGLDNPKVR